MKKYIHSVIVFAVVVLQGCAFQPPPSAGAEPNINTTLQLRTGTIAFDRALQPSGVVDEDLAVSTNASAIETSSSTNSRPRPRPGTALAATQVPKSPTFNYGDSVTAVSSVGPITVPADAKVVVIQPPKKIGFALFDVDVNIHPAGPRPVRIIKQRYYPGTSWYYHRHDDYHQHHRH